MTSIADVSAARDVLLARYETLETKSDILKAPELRNLLGAIRDVEQNDRAAFGLAVNELRNELKTKVESEVTEQEELNAIDVTAPFDITVSRPSFLPAEQGTIHPLSAEIDTLSDIFERMGFAIESPREIDD